PPMAAHWRSRRREKRVPRRPSTGTSPITPLLFQARSTCSSNRGSDEPAAPVAPPAAPALAPDAAAVATPPTPVDGTGRSVTLARVFERIEPYARLGVTVLITGPS